MIAENIIYQRGSPVLQTGRPSGTAEAIHKQTSGAKSLVFVGG